jgi:hypothetical protein
MCPRAGVTDDRGMKTLILSVTCALALLLPAAASARPIIDRPINTPAPAAPAPAPPALAPDDDQSPLGYLLVGLGGLALGAGGSLTLRRVVA